MRNMHAEIVTTTCRIVAVEQAVDINSGSNYMLHK